MMWRPVRIRRLPESDVGLWLYAQARRDKALRDKIGTLSDFNSMYSVTEAACDEAVRRLFPSRPRPEAVARFVCAIHSKYEIGEDASVGDAEALVHNALSQGIAINHIPRQSRLTVRYFVFIETVEQLRLSDRALASLLIAAERKAEASGCRLRRCSE